MTKENLQPISELMTSALAPIHTHLNQIFPLIINERKNQPPAVQMHKAGGWFYKS